MVRRVSRRTQPGQSATLIALVLVVLFAMVGLAVDVGNTYAEQRSTIRATDAATIAAMDGLINSSDGSDSSTQDPAIGAAICSSFYSNGIDADICPTPVGAQPRGNPRTVTARYLDNRRQIISDCNIGNCGGVPQGATYIQVEARGRIDTFFARIVQANTLPVYAKSLAQRCSPVNGVFPLGVAASDIKGGSFTGLSSDPNYKLVVDSSYPGMKLYQRRLQPVPPTTPGALASGQFTFLRWRGDSSTLSTAWLDDAFQAQGNLSSGMEEVKPWPDTSVRKPDGYPVKPNELSQQDWLYGYPGWPSDATLSGRLQNLINSRTQLILPILSKGLEVGGIGAYQFDRLGLFLLRGFSPAGADGAYVDMVYLGDAKSVACLATQLVENNPVVGLNGSAQLRPSWAAAGGNNLPVAYTILLDFSGSTGWNFQGLGYDPGTPTKVWQCEQYTPGLTYNGQVVESGVGTSHCNRGANSTSPWNKEGERRITIAKQAIVRLIQNKNPEDAVRIIGFSDAFTTPYFFKGKSYRYARAYPSETDPVPDPVDGKPGWTTKASYLIPMLNNNTGPRSNQPDKLPQGGTSGADAVKLAFALLDPTNKAVPQQSASGKSYKQALIYVTDGVTNIFEQGKQPPGKSSWNNWYGAGCGTTQSDAIANNPYCQIGYTSDGFPLPIQAMIDETRNVKQQSKTNLQIFALALGNANGTGLDSMADPNSSWAVSDPSLVNGVFDLIQTSIDSPCQVVRATSFMQTMGQANMPPASVAQQEGYKTPNQVGWVLLTAKDGTSLTEQQSQIPIVVDNSGKISYSLPQGVGLPPGEYLRQVNVWYKTNPVGAATGDGKPRNYSSILPSALSDPQDGKDQDTLTISQADASGGVVSLKPVFLDLNVNFSAHICTVK